MAARTKLTANRVRDAICPPEKPYVRHWDAGQPGLSLRVYNSGRKVYFFYYRPRGGGPARWLTLGDATTLSLKAAQDAARVASGKVAAGEDPVADRQEGRRRARVRLEQAIGDYEADLLRRKIVKASDVVSVLRRGLLQPLGNRDLSELTRNELVRRVDAVRDAGQPGAALELRRRMAAFLNWAADRGLIAVSPLAGWRQPRRSRAERIEQPGRSLRDYELGQLWCAADAVGWPFGPYVLTLLLTGQRRAETASMRWADVDLANGVWNIAAEITKSGRAHRVPLQPELVAILQNVPRLRGNPWVFAGRDGVPMSGYSKRMKALQALAPDLEPFTLHDLRRTVRTGLSALGVAPHVAELMLNHAVKGALAQAYDRHDFWDERVAAAIEWSKHVKQPVADARLITIP